MCKQHNLMNGRKSNVDGIRILKVVEVRSVCGKGTEDDPVHRVLDYFNFETGQWLARNNLKEDE